MELFFLRSKHILSLCTNSGLKEPATCLQSKGGESHGYVSIRQTTPAHYKSFLGPNLGCLACIASGMCINWPEAKA
jgi:hypothetical protein